MNDKCFEIGTIQAFLDGETTPELSFSLTDHTAACDKCALLLSEAEEENSQVFAMLDREMNALVPTQRLWSSITVALAEQKQQATLWDKVRSGLLAFFANPSLTVAAGVLVVFGLFAGVWSLRTPVSTGTSTESASVQVADKANQREEFVNTTGDTGPIPPTGSVPFQVKVTNLSPAKIEKLARTTEHRPESNAIRAEPAVLRTSAAEAYLPGEDSYLRTISDLKQSVDGRKDLILDPSSRISYERDIAVVNDAITRMKEVVKKNPKNQAAKQVLYSSYQNKIDLLSSVVEREELMASLQ